VDWQVAPRGASRLAENLAARREEAALYKQLATLRTDVPLAEDLEDLRWRGARRKQLAELCKELGDRRLEDQVPHWRD
jgi:5'-3' exonuclease